MSQRDLTAELRATRITAPAEVRERVRLIAAADTVPNRRFTWRRALVVALPVAAAVAAIVVVTRPASDHSTELRAQPRIVRGAVDQATQPGAAAKSFAAPVPASPTRVQRYGASLALRVPTPDGVSNAVKRALTITSSLGGYPVSVHASTHGKTATADLTLKVPRLHVQEAITRLSQLGTITGEQVDVQDLEAGLDAADRLIARLQRTLAGLRAQPQTNLVKSKIAAVTTRIVQLQRQQATTIRGAHYATVNIHLATPQVPTRKGHHGPLHLLVVALTWLGIGAIYAIVLATPVLVVAWLAWLLVRTIRRRREDALLSRS